MLAAVLFPTPSALAAPQTIDWETMSYDEWVVLKDQLLLAMWASEEWQEVAVPQDVYPVGEDIPAGHWTLTPLEGGLRLCEVGAISRMKAPQASAMKVQSTSAGPSPAKATPALKRDGTRPSGIST